MGLYPESHPALISGVGIAESTGEYNAFIMDQVELFGDTETNDIVLQWLGQNGYMNDQVAISQLSPEQCGCGVK